MLEMLINPLKAERKPWEMFFIGLVYASVSILLVGWIFSKDAVLRSYSGILVVMFTVMFSIPFIFYIFRLEEKRSAQENSGMFELLKHHRFALWAFLWLFVGFVVGYAFWYIILPTTLSAEAQLMTFCNINQAGNEACIDQFRKGVEQSGPTAFASNKERLFLIFANNIYVLIFTLIFSLLFGAGVIFILAWNASVIAAAISIFSTSSLNSLPIALFRYLIHGIPEIAAYFVAALAGGIISFAVIRREVGTEKFWKVLQDSLNLIILAVVILFIAAMMEVFVTPIFFR
ncbi:MAG: stage II sporulation protein M [Candidatus Pacearchaeota archaeon]|nr:stage II sporulation protein M [Candidatus Pacearchaeota archaeon]